MTISIFELFSIGVGPSSSHTVGPMRAAKQFNDKLQPQLDKVTAITVDLFGSLALTGKGHGTDRAILSGLEGHSPETVDPDALISILQRVQQQQQLKLSEHKMIAFDYDNQLSFHIDTFLAKHSNGMRITAYQDNEQIEQQTYYSIGGGFIVTDEHFHLDEVASDVPYPFHSAAELLQHCQQQQLSIPALMLENEKTWRTEDEIRQGILNIANIMLQSIENGCQSSGILPGGLNVKRRAASIYQQLQQSDIHSESEECDIMNWLNCFAIAVNEENAAGRRIVTAPTNGAAGVLPAVLRYHQQFHQHNGEQDIIDFLLTAAAIAILYKKGASISAAEVGCQGEIGVACSMAAAALTMVMGGTIDQIENAAEIGMEHHLGLTCDPIKGLVQIPCIERNAMGAVQAVNSARLALLGDGQQHVTLDKVIATMLQTGHDMQSQYKETSLGGLAANHPEC